MKLWIAASLDSSLYCPLGLFLSEQILASIQLQAMPVTKTINKRMHICIHLEQRRKYYLHIQRKPTRITIRLDGKTMQDSRNESRVQLN